MPEPFQPKQMNLKQDSANRRDFVRASAAIAAVGATAMASTAKAEEHSAGQSLLRPGDTILFQGDSITDTKRDRETADQPNQKKPLGKGYAWLAAATTLVDRPDDDLKFYNRGISGNKVFQLADRWQQDCLDLKPNVLSILIGVNDIWHKLNGKYDGTVEIYERDYHALIERTKLALPGIKLVICEPFVLRCGAVGDPWFPMFDGYRAAAKRVSDAAGAVFVPFQTVFDRAIKHAPPEHWASDGVHPSSAGAALMAHAWLRAVDA
ncbi:MAG: SGNH/GDSL hydrolase family protein [Planctomycetota bacterium]